MRSARQRRRSCSVRKSLAVTARGDMSGFIGFVLERADVVQILAAPAKTLHRDQTLPGHHREGAVCPRDALPTFPRGRQSGRHHEEIEVQHNSRA